jgi:hypothetical protein
MEIKNSKKIEIVVDTIYIGYIVEILEKFNIENWTIIRDVVGKINSNFKYEGEISANSYIFFTCQEDKFYKVLQELKEFINKFGGLLIYYDIKSI